MAWNLVWTGLVLLALGVAAAGQRPKPGLTQASGAMPAGAGAALTEMADAAGVIFTGQVETVTRNDAAGYVDVRFRIEQAVKGSPKNGVYVLREWAGLWVAAPERYRVGQRMLMLLTARGASGLSAPVGGMDGAIPLVATGREPLVHGTGVAPTDDGVVAAAAVDLRWVMARVERGAVTAQAESAAARGWSGPVRPIYVNGEQASRAVSLSAVLAAVGSAGGSGNAR